MLVRGAVDVPDHGIVLGAWVKRERERLGLTQEEIVGLMGPDADVSFLRRLETGRRRTVPEEPELGQLARALRTTNRRLLTIAGLLSDEEGTSPAKGPDPKEVQLLDMLSQLDPRDVDEVLDFAEFLQQKGRRRLVGGGVGGEADDPDDEFGGRYLPRGDGHRRAVAEGRPYPEVVGTIGVKEQSQ